MMKPKSSIPNKVRVSSVEKDDYDNVFSIKLNCRYGKPSHLSGSFWNFISISDSKTIA